MGSEFYSLRKDLVSGDKAGLALLFNTSPNPRTLNVSPNVYLTRDVLKSTCWRLASLVLE